MEEQRENVFIVFPGMPVKFSDLMEAFASKLCQQDSSKRATVMSADPYYVDHALTAVNVGVVIHASENVDNPFIDKQWEED